MRELEMDAGGRDEDRGGYKDRKDFGRHRANRAATYFKGQRLRLSR